MSKPPPFLARRKDDPTFDFFVEDLLLSITDLHRAIGEFELVSTPSTSSSSGVPGMMAYDSNYLYVCVSQDTWKRVSLSTW